MYAPDGRSTVALFLALTVVVGTLIAGGVAGQVGQDETATAQHEQDTSFLRVAHVSPDAPPVDVYVDGNETLSGLAFGNASDYLTIAAGEHEVRITPAGDNETTVFNGTLTVEARSATTLFAAGEVSEDATAPFAPIVFEDDAFVPAENESAISVAHMSPDAPTVDVTANNGSVVLADNLSYRNASEYVTVPDGEHTVEVRAATPGNNGTVVTTVDVSLEGGTAYSALAIGYLDANESADEEPFSIALIEDATKTIHLPSEEPAETETPAVETETPEPVTETPAPETETPEPVTETPELETETPEPETETPEPVTETPELDTETPEPETETETEA